MEEEAEEEEEEDNVEARERERECVCVCVCVFLCVGKNLVVGTEQSVEFEGIKCRQASLSLEAFYPKSKTKPQSLGTWRERERE